MQFEYRIEFEVRGLFGSKYIEVKNICAHNDEIAIIKARNFACDLNKQNRLRREKWLIWPFRRYYFVGRIYKLIYELAG